MTRRIYTLAMIGWLPTHRCYCAECGERFTATPDTRFWYHAEMEVLFPYCNECGMEKPLYDPRHGLKRRRPETKVDRLEQEIRQHASNFKPS